MLAADVEAEAIEKSAHGVVEPTPTCELEAIVSVEVPETAVPVVL